MHKDFELALSAYIDIFSKCLGVLGVIICLSVGHGHMPGLNSMGGID